MTTAHRLNYAQVAPEVVAAMLPMTRYLLEQSGLEDGLINLMQLRASQINGCAFCVVMHIGDARDDGETDDRLHALVVWRETPYFTPRERIALEWTEILTRLPDNRVSDDLYERALAEFGDKGIASLTLAVAAINAWNRFGVAFEVPPSKVYRTKMALAHA
jgi:AhpD family alkylhydroperoxidase